VAVRAQRRRTSGGSASTTSLTRHRAQRRRTSGGSGVEEKDKWRVSVYDFINEARGAEEKDKWRFSVYDFINRVAEQELLRCLRQNTSLQPRQPCHQHLASSFHSPPQKFPPGVSGRSLHVGQIET
jgi:hypothetical protein